MEHHDLRGLDFTRMVIAKATNPDGNAHEHAQIAATRWTGESRPAWILRSLVNAGNTTDPNYAAALAAFGSAGSEFFSFARQRSVLGQMPEARRFPLRRRIVRATNGTTAHWVGDGLPVPVTAGAFAGLTLAALKLSAITAETNELLLMSDLECELIVRDDMAAAVIDAMDTSFCDPDNAGVPNLMPASVTHGAPIVTSTGHHSEDLASLIELFEGDLTRSYIISNPSTLTKFSGADRPDVGARGGSLLGIPVLSSRKCPADILALLDAGSVAYANDIPEISVTRTASIEMQSAPSSPATANTVLVSLFQAGMTGIKVDQVVNWCASASAVAVLNGLAASGI